MIGRATDPGIVAGDTAAVTLARNLCANLAGRLVVAVLGFVFVPLYVRLLGVESYALVGLFATLTAICAAADCGLSPSVNRELARLSLQPGNAAAMADLVRTLELGAWTIASLLGVAIILGAPWMARSWIGGGLPPGTVRGALAAMGLALALQWPVNFYSNGVVGLQHQVALNLINVLVALLRSVGAVLVLLLLSPSVDAFFAWQIIVSACHVGAVALLLWHKLPRSPRRPRVRAAALRQVWRFAAGMSGLSVILLLHTQLDKLVLSRVLTLAEFGYYSLAWTLASSIYMLCYPITLAFLPRLSQLVSIADTPSLRRSYHDAAQIMAVAILPVTIFIALFAREILLAWTRDPVIAERAGPILVLLTIGAACDALANVALALQWAYGRTGVAFWANLAALVLQIPLIFPLAQRFGAAGGAAVWLLGNAAVLIVSVPLVHRRMLAGETWTWLRRDVVPALAASLLIALGWRMIDAPHRGMLEALHLAGAATTILFAAALATPASLRIAARLLPGKVSRPVRSMP